jgi:hypothetical protein
MSKANTIELKEVTLTTTQGEFYRVEFHDRHIPTYSIRADEVEEFVLRQKQVQEAKSVEHQA